jgi:hypothetical protein
MAFAADRKARDSSTANEHICLNEGVNGSESKIE